MKNSLLKILYHYFICLWYKIDSYRGGWMLTHQFLTDYKERKNNFFTIAKIHLKGWSYNDWRIIGITDKNKKFYLSTKQYCSLHPFNHTFSSWIDDKLTLKYVLNGTKANIYMPDYYYQITDKGRIIPLMDLDITHFNNSFESIIDLLERKKALAFKLTKGSLGEGFYKAEYINNTYLLNGKKYSKIEFKNQIQNLKGYLITEYLFPHAEFARFCKKSVGCIRFVIGRKNDGTLIDIYSFIRFGTKQSHYVENYNTGGVLSIIQNGRFNDGNILDLKTKKNIRISTHPDNNIVLKGTIPHWNKIVEAAHIIAETMPQLSYMGIDFCVTNDNRIKIIEINSLSSLDALQINSSILENDESKVFFEEKLNLLKKNK